MMHGIMARGIMQSPTNLERNIAWQCTLMQLFNLVHRGINGTPGIASYACQISLLIDTVNMHHQLVSLYVLSELK